MNKQAGFKALKFVCMPTIALITLLFFGFFSITKTIEFISSNAPLAIALRIITFILECVLYIYMYYKYKEQEDVNKIRSENHDLDWKHINRNSSIYYAFKNSSSSDDFEYDQITDNLIVIKRIK